MYPNRHLSHIPGTVDWRTGSALSWVEKWVGRDPAEEILQEGREHQFYKLGVPRPHVHNVHESVHSLFGGETWLIFDDTYSHGEFMDDLEWESEELIGEHAGGDEVLRRAENVVFLPRSVYLEMTAERREKASGVRDLLDFGFAPLLQINTIECLRIDGWKQVPKHPILSVDSADVSYIIKPKDKALNWQGDSFLFLKDKSCPDKFERPGQDTDIKSSWFESVYRNGVLLARPAHRSDIDMSLRSPLDTIETLYMAPPQASGQITLDALARFLEAKFPGTRVRSAKDCARVLGNYLNKKEDDLAKAIALPRVCVHKDKDFNPQGYDRVELLDDVQDSLPEVKSSRGFAGVDTWVRKLLCRALLLIHMRGGHIADMNYRTTMYPLVDLLYSMIKAPKGDTAPYLRPMLLLGSLSQPVRRVKEKKVVAKEAIQEIPDDLFQ